MASHEGIGSLRALAGVNLNSQRSHILSYDDPIVVEESMADRVSDYVQPINGLNAGAGGTYEFSMPPVGETFLLLNKCYLDIKMKVVKKDGQDCRAEDNYSLINNFGQSMWRRCDIFLNGVQVMTECAEHVNYKSYLESIVSFDSDSARECNLVTNIFHMDTPGQYTNSNTKTKADKDGNVPDYNMGYVLRRRHCEQSREFDAAPKIPHPFFRCEKALAPNIKLGVKLTMASDDFMILSNTNDYKLKLIDIKLRFTRIRKVPHAVEPNMETYSFTMTELRIFPIPTHMPTYHVPVSIGGLIPKQVIFFMTGTNAFEGAAGTNPFYFRHFDLTYHHLKVNEKTYPPDGLSPNFTSTPPIVMRELHELKANTGFEGTDKSNCITYQQYTNGCTIFPHDLTPDLCNSAHLHPSEVGPMVAKFDWKGNGPMIPITIFAYMVYDAALTHKPSEMYFQTHVI